MDVSRRGVLKAGLAAGAVANTGEWGPGDRVFQPGSLPYLQPGAGGLPSRVFGTYWPSWDGPALSSLPSAYNTVWLFAAVPVGGPPGATGAVYWSQSRESTTQFNADLAALRASGRCVLLSVGGAGSYIQLDTQARSDAFVASVESIYAQLSGFDGIDFDIEGGIVWPDQLVYISRALRSAYGSMFAVTFPPAPWSSADKATCSALYAAGVLDLVAPQYYDLTGLSAETDKISNEIDSIETTWIPLVGGEASKVGLGYGLASVVSETMTLDSFSTVWTTLAAKYPQLRGAFCWEAAADAAESWSFSTTLGPLIAG